MPLQRYELEGKVYANSPALQLAEEFNKLIDHINALEARLVALEHPVERLSDETAPKCNCMVVNDKRVCPQHDAVITNDYKC